MKEYIFVLGRDSALSLLEIASFLKSRKIIHRIGEYNDFYVAVEADNLDSSYIISRLGGTLKIAEVVKNFNGLYNGKKNKITYTINVFTDNEGLVRDAESRLKKVFKEQGLRAFYRKHLEKRPSRSSLIDVEIVVAGDRVGRVVAVSNPKSYISRDEKRPNFDAAKVISLRLARILINLSEIKEGQTLLDPFCGLGTIMQEALLMGVNAVGVDNDKETVRKAGENLRWLGSQHNGKWKIIEGDSKRLSNYIREADAVVTEPYMGPFLKKVFDYESALKLKNELEKLYYNVLVELRKIVKGKVVFVFPRFKTKKGRVKINAAAIIEKTGFKIYSSFKGVGMPIPYFHKRSVVERMIYVLE